MKIKPCNKPRGRPKHSGTVWPKKCKGKGKRLTEEHSQKKCKGKRSLTEKHTQENVAPAKKLKLINTVGTPAYRAKLKRKSKKNTTVDSYDLTEIEAEESTSYSFAVVIGYEKLTMSDLERLKSSTGWLNGSLINAGQILLQKKFPNVHGFQNVCLARTLSFVQQRGPFIQILNVDDSHWVCVTNSNCEVNSLKIFDSRRVGEVSLQTKEILATLLHCDKRTISIVFPYVQQQTDNDSCGLFALAFAYSLCEGINPSEVAYQFKEFRQHFLSCLQQKEISAFPCEIIKEPANKPLSVKFQVYCLCRLPDTGDDMICCNTCLEWYHFTCVQISPGMTLPDDWYCSRCC